MRLLSPLVFTLSSALAFAVACSDGKTASDDEDDDAGESGDGGTTGGNGSGGTTGGTESSAGGTTGGTEGSTGGSTGGSGDPAGGTGGSTGGNGSGGTTGGTTGGTGGDGTGGTGGTGGAEGTTGGTGGDGSGGSLIGTGGTAGAGGAGGGGAGTPACGAAFHAWDGGYVTTPALNGGCWQGHAYTGTQITGSSVTPTDFETCGDPCMLCASGLVAPDLAFGGVAWLGFNLNQLRNDEAAGTVTPTGTGIMLNFINEGGSPLRVQLGGPNADTLESDRWCVEIAGTSGNVMIPYAAFNTQCWDALGIPYAGEPIENIQLLVPGNDVASQSFAICMAAVTEY